MSCNEATLERLVATHGQVITTVYTGSKQEPAIVQKWGNFGGGVFNGCP